MYECWQVSLVMYYKNGLIHFMHHDLINTKTNQPICNVTQIRVRYSKKPFNNDSSGHKNYLPEEDWEDIGQGPPIGNVILQDTPLLVNVKGILICNSDETMLKAFFLCRL